MIKNPSNKHECLFVIASNETLIVRRTGILGDGDCIGFGLGDFGRYLSVAKSQIHFLERRFANPLTTLLVSFIVVLFHRTNEKTALRKVGFQSFFKENGVVAFHQRLESLANARNLNHIASGKKRKDFEQQFGSQECGHSAGGVRKQCCPIAGGGVFLQ